MRRFRRVRRPLAALVALVAALAIGYGVRALNDDRGGNTPSASPSPRRSSLAAATQTPSPTAGVALSSLPTQLAQTVALVEAGGPYPYPRNDGVVFRNAESRLPEEPDGYYHEYTVPTPGSPDRGARRLITGRADEYWYTADHYETFVRVDVTR